MPITTLLGRAWRTTIDGTRVNSGNGREGYTNPTEIDRGSKPTKELHGSPIRDLEFANGDKVFLKVAPMKGVTRFGKRGKLNPRYIGPYEILDRVGPLAYRLALPPHLSGVHNVFHVSALRKYVADPSHVLEAKTIPIRENLS